MGIQLHLIDQRSPRGFTFIPDVIPAGRRGTYPILRMSRPGLTPDSPMYAMMSLVGPNDTLVAVVNNILSQYGQARRLDVIRIEGHGRVAGVNNIVNAIEFSNLMDAATVTTFTRIVHLWSRAYAPIASGTSYDAVIPRIEIHGCQPVHGCDPILQALANASQAAVFASSAVQTVNLTRG